VPHHPPITTLETAPLSGRPRYCRLTDLPKLTGLWPSELADTSHAGRQRLIAKLERALRQERMRGLAGHWTYDLARHSQLVAAYRQELRAFTEESAPATGRTPPICHRPAPG